MDRQYTWQNYYMHAAPRCLQVLACFTRVQVLHALLLGKAWLKTCMQRCVGILQYKYSHTFSQRYSQYLHSNLHKTFTISSQNLHKTITISSQNPHKTFTKPSQNLHKIFTNPSQNLHNIFTKHGIFITIQNQSSRQW